MTVPKGGGSRELGVTKEAAPKSFATLDQERQAVIERLSTLSLTELEKIQRQVLVNRLADLDEDVLQEILRERVE